MKSMQPERKFVLHRNDQGIPVDRIIKVIESKSAEFKSCPETSVIIPTCDGYRDGYFPKLLAQINQQDFEGFQILVVKGDQRQGRAINIAAAMSKGKYLLTLDDDTMLPDNNTFKKLVGVLEKYPEIGIAGGNNIIPADATPFIKQAMKQIPRRSWQAVSKITISDLAEHPCMIMRAKDFKKVGGENELIYRGLDPYLREEFRKLNKLVVIVPNVIYHHLPPKRAYKLFRQFFRNGIQACITNRLYPEWVIETPNHHGEFQKYKTKLQRRTRFFITLTKSIITVRFIHFLSEMAYALGYVWGMVKKV